MIGILITTIGILFLVLGLLGASLEVYAQLLIAILQQRLQQQLPEILQPQGETAPGGETGSVFDSTEVLTGLIENLINAPLWLALVVVGTVLIYSGLYITQRQRSGRAG